MGQDAPPFPHSRLAESQKSAIDCKRSASPCAPCRRRDWRTTVWGQGENWTTGSRAGLARLLFSAILGGHFILEGILGASYHAARNIQSFAASIACGRKAWREPLRA